MAGAVSLRDLYRDYNDRVQFILVYTREAHPTDGWYMGDHDIRNHKSMEERRDHPYTARLAGNRLPNVERVDRGLEELGMDGQFDAAFAVLTVHDAYNFRGEEVAAGWMDALHGALRSGGTLAFIDHAGDAGQDNRGLHRMEQSIAERLITEAGFVIQTRSDLLANPADDHTVNVFDPSIRRRTDRFVIRAMKP